MTALQTELPVAAETRRAAFFDRDGVLNVDSGFVHKADDFVWRETAIETVRWLNDRGILVFVVTNQSGVARGFYAEADVLALHDHMQDALSQRGARIDEFRHCPHHPEGTVEAYRLDCNCRKPRSGMIEALLAQWSLNPLDCLMFGDRESDIVAAQGAGVRGILVVDDRPLLAIVRQAFAG